jgi:hypothetical protein
LKVTENILRDSAKKPQKSKLEKAVLRLKMTKKKKKKVKDET